MSKAKEVIQKFDEFKVLSKKDIELQADQLKAYLDKASSDRDKLKMTQDWFKSKDFSDDDKEAISDKYYSKYVMKK